MVFFEPADLMGLERKERGLEPGEKSGAEDQDRDRKKEKDENASRHFSLRRQWRDCVPLEDSSVLVCPSSQRR